MKVQEHDDDNVDVENVDDNDDGFERVPHC